MGQRPNWTLRHRFISDFRLQRRYAESRLRVGRCCRYCSRPFLAFPRCRRRRVATGFGPVAGLPLELSRLRWRTRSNSFLGFRNAAGKLPQADDDYQFRKTGSKTLAERTGLANCEGRKRGDICDFETALLHLIQHVVHGSDGQISCAVPCLPKNWVNIIPTSSSASSLAGKQTISIRTESAHADQIAASCVSLLRRASWRRTRSPKSSMNSLVVW